MLEQRGFELPVRFSFSILHRDLRRFYRPFWTWDRFSSLLGTAATIRRLCSRILRTKRDPGLSLIEDLDNVDLKRFPRCAQTTRYECELAAGELIFVPGGWWHTTKIITTSITVSINIANASNWRTFIAEECRRLTLAGKLRHGAYLVALGSYRWVSDQLQRRLDLPNQ